MNRPTWNGVYPALLTPFDERDEVDLSLFSKNIRAQVAAGVSGLIIGGSLGEASTLTRAELKKLLVQAKEEARNALPVIVNVAEQSTTEAIKAAREAEKEGANGLMLLPPLRYRADDREAVEYLSAVAGNTSLPIMIYNNPWDYGITVSLDMFDQLARHENIEAVKESTRDVSNVTRMKNRFGDRYRILCGVDTLTMEELMLGADGLVAGLVDAFPAETVTLFRLVKAGRYAEALELYRWFLPLLELDIHPKLVQYIKLAASRTGLGSEYVRAPRLQLIGEERERILSIINQALETRPALADYAEITSLESTGQV